ncbi:hypothetical protein DH2020_014496 [Rehmannia glutinosa]|uniref:Uncharacterized protein n=1 Tax=Rehmannia glutinosa TaxID=99300 RepID=A0ABR0WZ50_REHGL
MGFKDTRQVSWAAAIKNDGKCESIESISINIDSEASSISSSLSVDLADDASSSSTSSTSSPSSSGPLFELSQLLAQLPIKRGLSKYYNGKSQTFASLTSVKSVEDLSKKETCYSMRMKSCKSYGGNLNHHKFGPKATIAKRSPKSSFSPPLTTKGALVVNSRNPILQL